MKAVLISKTGERRHIDACGGGQYYEERTLRDGRAFSVRYIGTGVCDDGLMYSEVSSHEVEAPTAYREAWARAMAAEATLAAVREHCRHDGAEALDAIRREVGE